MPKLYREQHKADALAVAAAERNLTEASRLAGVPRSTLADWLAKPDRHVSPESRDLAKKDLAQAVDVSRWAYLGRMLEPDAIAATSGYYAGQTVRALTEVHQLLTGGATHRVEGLFAFLAGYREGGGKSDPDGGEG